MSNLKAIVNRKPVVGGFSDLGSITLELNVLQAAALMTVLNSVGGIPGTTPRGLCEEVRSMLLYSVPGVPVKKESFGVSIYFADDTLAKFQKDVAYEVQHLGE